MSNDKETLQEKREAVQAAKQMFSADTGSLEEKLLRIGMGEKVDSPELNPTGFGGGFIDTSADHPEAAAEHINFDSVFAKLGYKPQSQPQGPLSKAASVQASKSRQDLGDLTEVVADIASFKFSSSNRGKEIGMIREAVKKELRNIISQRVIENTKKISSDVHQFYRIKDGKDGGMRVEFSLLNHKFSMSALGEFSGNECLCWQANGNTIVGHVMSVGEDGFENVTDSFQVSITEGWKE